MDHTYYKCPPSCDRMYCPHCQGGLSYCTVCKGAEGSLTQDCCGRPITEEEERKIYNEGTLDYRDGQWVQKANGGRSSKPKEE